MRPGSNLYAVFEPAERLPVHHAAPRQFPSAMFAALARMLGWSKLETTDRAALHENHPKLAVLPRLVFFPDLLLAWRIAVPHVQNLFR